MRILIDARHLRDFGFGTYTRNLIRSLAVVGPEHHYLLVIHRRHRPELEGLPDNFEIIEYERSDQSGFDNVAFPWLARSLRPDLTHIPLNVVPLLMPRPYVVTVHDLSSLIFDKASGWRHDLHLLRVRRGLQRAARVLAVSKATERDLQALLGVPPSRIRVVYGAADPRFGEARSEDEPRLKVLERYQVNYPFFLYSGTIRPQKNIPRLVEAFALLKGELADHPVCRDLKLIIIGDEISKYPAVRQAVVQSRRQKDVRFLGFVPLDTLRAFYESATAFVFPSLYEGFGLPPLEAMACGTPVVASNLSSIPEVVGDAAVMVNPENVFDIARGMKEILMDEAGRRRLVALGTIRQKQFSWDRTAREVLATYWEAAGFQAPSKNLPR